MPTPITTADLESALKKAASGALPSLAVTGDDKAAQIELTYPFDLYTARTSADTDAIAALDGWSIGKAESRDVHVSELAPPVTTTVTYALIPSPTPPAKGRK